jgi:hypothetical protein
MSKSRASVVLNVLNNILREPRQSFGVLRQLPFIARGFEFGQQWKSVRATTTNNGNNGNALDASNPLRSYFEAHTEGRGIWKWDHYFDVYHRHFSKFIGREVHVMEIGVFSGGSLPMWREYFGPNSQIYGVDIEEACRIYEEERTKIIIGDQADREFWKKIRNELPRIDVLIDDGGHEPHQQIVTLEEMLPHISPGGVFLCEDIHGIANEFNSYVSGFTAHLNSSIMKTNDKVKGVTCSATQYQSDIQSIHFYPFSTVIEKTERPIEELNSPRHGTEWQPFL